MGHPARLEIMGLTALFGTRDTEGHRPAGYRVADEVCSTAELLEDGEERASAEGLLRGKYPQYRDLLDPGCAVIAITPTKTVAWGRVG